MHISFTPLEKSHFPLLLNWLESPHVKAWWDQDIIYNMDLVKQKFGHYVQGYKLEDGERKAMDGRIILLDNQPIGYIQCYNAYDYPREGGVSLEGLPTNLAAIDFYIGDISYIGKGLGLLLLKQFLNEIVFKKFAACFVDPDTANKSAICSYEKSGFKKVREVNNCIWMIKEK
jgi:aminoglycoside 6'-N-acetyltransferase